MAAVTDAEKYGYGTLAVFIVSLLGLLGIVVIPCWKKVFYNRLLVVLTGLAISTLFCDAVLHILPHVVEASHDNGSKSSVITVTDPTVRCVLVVIALYLFWLFEVLMNKVLGGEGHAHSHGGHSHSTNEVKSIPSVEVKPPTGDVEIVTVDAKDTTTKEEEKPRSCEFFRRIKPTAWMLIIGDVIHNFCDGLAIGVSFSESISLGIATTIAVVCHEIPHEIGDYAVFVQYGFKHWQALVINFGTTITCFIGFYIGASVPSDSGAATWVLSITAGMFFYIALVDLMPHLSFEESGQWSWLLFVFVNLAMVLGFAIMFLLAVFEEHIRIGE